LAARHRHDKLIGRVLAAAVAAAVNRESAERATVRSFAEAAGGTWDADELAATAVRLALRRPVPHRTKGSTGRPP